MKSKQMRKYVTRRVIPLCLTFCLCCTVPYSPVLAKTTVNYIMKNSTPVVYASELTNFVNADNSIPGETAASNDTFDEAQDSAISTNDVQNELEMAIMRKQNTQPVMTAAYTELKETASKGAIDDEKAAEQQRLIEEAAQAEQAEQMAANSQNADYDYSKEVTAPQSSHITDVGGVFEGPSGHETYYNLPMDGVIQIMRSLGYSEEDGWVYWVRDDGAKMFGDYVMVAADLNIHPRGSLVECSLGTAIVCDTGDFIQSNAYQLDIAVTWETT